MMSLSALEQWGLVHLYVGDGKGKTTAAIGLCARAAGHGIPVILGQFLKGRKSGETAALSRLGIPVYRADITGKFVHQMNEQEREAAREEHALLFARLVALSRQTPGALLVLDEVVDAVNCGMVDLDALVALIETRPPGTEIVLTGRDPAPALAALADYYTEFVCKAHPFSRGVAARPGVDF